MRPLPAMLFEGALLLREGTVVAQGLLTETVTSEHLSKAFGLPLLVRYEDGRFTARAG